MESSSPRSVRRPLLAVRQLLGQVDLRAVMLELLPRATIPATLLTLGDRASGVTLGLALATQVFVVARALWLGRELEARLVDSWHRLAAATLDSPLAALSRRGPREQASFLVYAAQREAQLGASVGPRLAADALGLALVALAVAARLGVRWLLVGLALGLVAAPLVLVLTARIRSAEERGYGETASLVEQCSVLLDGALEVRAHGLGLATVARAVEEASCAARSRRRVTVLRALASLGPPALLALLVATPTLRDALALDRVWLPAAVLGSTGVACALGLVASLGELASMDAERAAFLDFVGLSRTAAPAATEAHGDRADLSLGVVRFEGVSIRHSSSSRRTPEAFSARWDTRRGLALVGDNGAGKSSLVAALLGLVALDEGSVWLDDVRLTEALAARLRAQVAFVPQRPFVSPARTVAWHLRLLADPVDDAVLEAALERVGLLRALRARAPEAPLEVSVGSLSGGEQARMHLARLFLPRGGLPAAMIVVDEPEAGLDVEGRRAVRELLERLSAETPVLLVAHDEAVIPDSFVRAACRGGA